MVLGLPFVFRLGTTSGVAPHVMPTVLTASASGVAASPPKADSCVEGHGLPAGGIDDDAAAPTISAASDVGNAPSLELA